MAHRSHRQKGCALCKPWKNRGNGDARRVPFRVNRQVGRKRRWSRGDVD
ncbi:hypothetical protein GCM10025867_51260 (plasmid) [Frondihabitans sucicola]|uniref:50S ribosomal protein L32 n=1 Tax=Frondihabitans sucicola TaxID=1268041 RepID=A0ABM8GWL2_9MICO|nr:hypothetical protein [Frondihabitans sucicola]BDZ52317.1 hypothetical protein GCM10025867_45580 [Frondihabitans sucicola]BDZ52885.1 hypothetical protein GCM10025867_51260 [Frondihabitans sucicola]